MTPDDIETIRIRALQIMERDAITCSRVGIMAEHLYPWARRSKNTVEKYLRGDPLRQTPGNARAILHVFPEIGREQVVFNLPQTRSGQQ